MAKIAISHQLSRQLLTDLHQTFILSSHMYGDYKIDVSFAVAQGTLLHTHTHTSQSHTDHATCDVSSDMAASMNCVQLMLP